MYNTNDINRLINLSIFAMLEGQKMVKFVVFDSFWGSPYWGNLLKILAQTTNFGLVSKLMVCLIVHDEYCVEMKWSGLMYYNICEMIGAERSISEKEIVRSIIHENSNYGATVTWIEMLWEIENLDPHPNGQSYTVFFCGQMTADGEKNTCPSDGGRFSISHRIVDGYGV